MMSCDNCLEVYDPADFPRAPTHDQVEAVNCHACRTCWDQHVMEELSRKPAIEIECIRCPVRLQPEEVSSLISTTVYERYTHHFHNYCTTCSTVHTGHTCEAYAERVALEAGHGIDPASCQLMAQTTKRCPNPVCGILIEKKEGCDEMTCMSYTCLYIFVDARRY